MEDFLGFFIVLKVETSKNFLKVVGRVMHKLVKWLHDKGYMADDDYEAIDKRVKELKADLSAAVEASGLISEYAVKSPHEKYAKELNSRFTIKKIESGELWLEDFESTGELTEPC